MNESTNLHLYFCSLFTCIIKVDVDLIPNRKTSKSGVERMLEFGRELFQMSQRLEKENGANETNRKMLEVRKRSNIHAFRIIDTNYVI